LREVTLYYAILAALHTTVQEIARQVGLEPRGLAYYLYQLIEIGYIERRHPLTGEPLGPLRPGGPPAPLLVRFVFPTSDIRHMGSRPRAPRPHPPTAKH